MKISKKLTYGFSLIAVVLLVVGALASFNITKMGLEFNYLVEHDLNVLQNAQELHKLVVDAETGQRGFVITGKDEFLEPYIDALSNFDVLWDEEIVLVNDNIPQVERLGRIRSLFNKWQDIAAKPEIEARRDSTFLYAIQLVEKGTGKTVLDQVREEFRKFIQIENDLEQVRKIQAQEIEYKTKQIVFVGWVISILLLIVIAIVLIRSIIPAMARLRSASDLIAKGDLSTQIPIVGNDEITELSYSFNTMADNLRTSKKVNDDSLWLQSGVSSISEKLSGEFDVTELAKNTLNQLILDIDAQIGSFYYLENNNLILIASYGLNLENTKQQFSLGEGIVGQTAITKKPYLLKNVPENYTYVSTSVVSIQPINIAIIPVIFEEEVLGIIEIASISTISDLHLNLLNAISNRLGTAMSLAQSRETLKLNDKELKMKNEMLGIQNKELEHFAYIVSHDLKAPLRSISSLTAFIDEDLRANKNEEVYSHLDKMNGRIRRMENLIQGILDFSKIGMVKPEEELFDLNILVTEIYENMDAPKQFKFRIVTPLPSITGVKALYVQVFSNMISNAVKYNDKTKGSVEITYKDLPNSHEFSITDNGPGIPNKYHEKVFLAFQTLNIKDDYESTGIGLSIVQKIITHLKGSIRIETIKKGGAKFVIDLPKN